MAKGYDERYCRVVCNAYQKMLTFLKSPAVDRPDLVACITEDDCMQALNELDAGGASDIIPSLFANKISEKGVAEQLKQYLYSIIKPLSF